jgi:hypothetical protein
MEEIVDITIRHLKRNGFKVERMRKFELDAEYNTIAPHFDDVGVVEIFARLLPIAGVEDFITDVLAKFPHLPADTRHRVMENLTRGRVPCQKRTQ